jgi:subtilisin family serine protease
MYPGIKLTMDDQSTESHGNRCVSLVGARNKMSWNIGVAPESKTLLGKISINRELRDFDFILNGIEWAINQGADIISISYAAELNKEQETIFGKKFEELLTGNQVIVFAAAGNSSGVFMQGERYPGSFSGCISVGATNKDDSLSLTTIISEKTILHAPGIDIESFGKNNQPSPGTGTSFSTPIIAGIAGLAISRLKKAGKRIQRDALIGLMISTADPIPGHGNKKIVNAKRLLSQL